MARKNVSRETRASTQLHRGLLPITYLRANLGGLMRAMKKTLFLLVLTILATPLFYGCTQGGGVDTTGGLSEGAPTELADLPPQDGSMIIDNTKLGTNSLPLEDTDHDSIADE